MKNLVIDVFESDAPSATVRIPLFVLGLVSKLIPAVAKTALDAKGIDLKGLVEAAKNGEISGEILDVTDRKTNERVVISLT